MVFPVLVREVMTRDVLTASPETPVAEAVDRLLRADVGSLVVEDDGELVGIVTDTDFMRLLSSETDPTERTVEQCMTAPVWTIPESAPIVDAATELRTHRIDQLPVVEGDELVGLVSVRELAAFLPQYALHDVPAGSDAEGREWTYEFEDEGPEGISVGDHVRFSKVVGDADVRAFSRISGDQNPLHLDASFASKTRFERRIVHGLLAASLFSAALSHLPGLVIYLSQDLRFLEPVDVGERLGVDCEVIQALGNDRYRLSTKGFDEDGEEVLVGEAVVLVDPRPEARTAASETDQAES